jgi:hypothetical protein
MKWFPTLLAACGVLAATEASAQLIDLSGPYRCVQLCQDGSPGPAFVTQNGREMVLQNEAGLPSRAWIDWIGHIWAENWQQGAIYSPDGIYIQFDRGTVWQRQLEPVVVTPGVPPVVGPPPTAPAPRASRVPSAPPPGKRAPVERAAVPPDAYDGSWSVVISTQAGPCDPSYRFGVQIINGNIVYEGGGAGTAQGRVAPNGGVWVHVAAGGNQATGEGRLSYQNGAGAGTWRGQGPGGTCAGSWQAARRG